MRGGSIAALLIAAGALLGACAPPALQRPSTAALPPVRESFDASGRLSATHGTDALSANFQWRHRGDSDELVLASPLGQTIAVLTGENGSVRLQSSNGRALSAGTWTELTRQGLGWPLPVDGLKYWIQGSPRAGEPFTTEPGNEGRVAVLRQDGWTIVYQAYAQSEGVWRPSRLTATYPEVELRLAIDRWQ
ncbi:MAG TPA: lipoprotein insertase outer membrane protein LolB [Casimicrobiaceae bacterium]|nr:lipoprotein insertase outer membrane protein LolB [Casimicrobiaceae bacterium]